MTKRECRCSFVEVCAEPCKLQDQSDYQAVNYITTQVNIVIGVLFIIVYEHNSGTMVGTLSDFTIIAREGNFCMGYY